MFLSAGSSGESVSLLFPSSLFSSSIFKPAALHLRGHYSIATSLCDHRQQRLCAFQARVIRLAPPRQFSIISPSLSSPTQSQLQGLSFYTRIYINKSQRSGYGHLGNTLILPTTEYFSWTLFHL